MSREDQKRDDRPWVTVRRQTAYALALIGLPIVHRGTIRSMLPPGKVVNFGLQQHLKRRAMGYGTGGKNVTTKQFQAALAEFEREGWLTRGEEFLLIRDRRALFDYAMDGLDPARQSSFVSIDAAIDQISADIKDPGRPAKWVEQRRCELVALKRLMEQGFGSANWSGKKSVRFFPHSRVI